MNNSLLILKSFLLRQWKILVVIVIVGLALIPLRHVDFADNYEEFASWAYPGENNRKGLVFELILKVLAGLGVLYGLMVAHRRAKAMEKGVEKQTEQIELSRKSQIDERFKNAVEHLGRDNQPIVLGGIAELHQIAVENYEDYAQVISDIFCAYLRLELSLKRVKNISVNPNVDDNFLLKRKGIVLQSILDILFGAKHFIGETYHLIHKDLSYCDFTSLEFRYTFISEVDFTGSTINSLNCRDLTRINFTNSNLVAVSLGPGTIKDCEFTGTKISYSNFHNTEILNSNISHISVLQSEFYDIVVNSSIMNSKLMGSKLSNVQFLRPVENCTFVGNNLIDLKKTKKILYEHINKCRFRANIYFDCDQFFNEIVHSTVEACVRYTDANLFSTTRAEQIIEICKTSNSNNVEADKYFQYIDQAEFKRIKIEYDEFKTRFNRAD